MVTIKFNTDNAAFSDGDFSYEVSRILRRLADRFQGGDEPTKVMDVNGNSVGTVTIESGEDTDSPDGMRLTALRAAVRSARDILGSMDKYGPDEYSRAEAAEILDKVSSI